jgi:diaminopimelate epimerase
VGRKFWKMSGSGNDFVVFDSRGSAPGTEPLERPEAIQALCARGTGVGADGVVFVADPARTGATVATMAIVAMRYYNADSSRVAFCGNATLCVTRLAGELGIAPTGAVTIETDSGLVEARMGADGPEIDLPTVVDVATSVDVLDLLPGERRMGFAQVGVSHLVVRCEDVEKVDVVARGRALRNSSYRTDGMNVNFISAGPDGWKIRTYERGVEDETLACGSGAVASAIMLSRWSDGGDATSLVTRSGRTLRVRLRREGEAWKPTLAGEGRIVFTGELAELPN